MNPIIAAAIAQGIAALMEIWSNHANKPKGWVPTQDDWNELMSLSNKTPDDYKQEAAAQQQGNFTD